MSVACLNSKLFRLDGLSLHLTLVLLLNPTIQILANFKLVIWNSKFPPDNLSNLDAYLIAGDEVTKFNHVSENKRTNQVIKKTKCIGVQAKPSELIQVSKLIYRHLQR